MEKERAREEGTRDVDSERGAEWYRAHDADGS